MWILRVLVNRYTAVVAACAREYNSALATKAQPILDMLSQRVGPDGSLVDVVINMFRYVFAYPENVITVITILFLCHEIVRAIGVVYKTMSRFYTDFKAFLKERQQAEHQA